MELTAVVLLVIAAHALAKPISSEEKDEVLLAEVGRALFLWDKSLLPHFLFFKLYYLLIFL